MNLDELKNKLKQKERDLKEKELIIKKLLRENSLLRNNVKYDYLTGVLRSKAGREKLYEELSKSKTNNYKLTLCYIDADNLKKINDNYGHKEGDKLIRNICKCIRDVIRKDDFIIRIGGDEFLIIFPKINKQDAKKIVNRINERLMKKNENNNLYKMTFTYGLSEYNGEGLIVLDKLIEKADRDMYKYKKIKYSKNKFTVNQ